eukprot:194832-Chlamydomonas_euryale.AAC.1
MQIAAVSRTTPPARAGPSPASLGRRPLDTAAGPTETWCRLRRSSSQSRCTARGWRRAWLPRRVRGPGRWIGNAPLPRRTTPSRPSPGCPRLQG